MLPFAIRCEFEEMVNEIKKGKLITENITHSIFHHIYTKCQAAIDGNAIVYQTWLSKVRRFQCYNSGHKQLELSKNMLIQTN